MKSVLKKWGVVCLAVPVVLSITYSLAWAGGRRPILNVPSVLYPTIQSAINAAVPGDIVQVAPGVYNENINFLGKAITVIGTGGMSQTTIDGMQAGSVVTFNSGETFNAILDGFTITNGSGTVQNTPQFVRKMGGGIYIERRAQNPQIPTTPTIQNCHIYENHLHGEQDYDLYGGGIFVYEKHDFTVGPLITNCIIERNSLDTDHGTQKDAWGGGICCRGGRTMIQGCQILGNWVYGFSNWDLPSAIVIGGGIFVDNMDNDVIGPYITDCDIRLNFVTGWGGGIYSANSTPAITGCNIQNNMAQQSLLHGYDNTGRGGGGIVLENHNGQTGKPTVSNCSIVANTADWEGGGVLLYGLDALIDDCDISVNTGTADYASSGGGGLFSYQSNFIMTNSLVTGNAAVGSKGGGLYLSWSMPGIINCNVVNNFGSHGGGLCCYNEGHAYVENSIFWNNDAAIGPEAYLDSDGQMTSSLTIDYSDLTGGSTSISVGSNSTLIFGANMINADPQFTSTSHLPSTSPCIDMGNNNASNLPSLDFDGQLRIMDGSGTNAQVVDMGADEFLMPLTPSVYSVSASVPSTVNFALNAGPANGGRTYVLLGGVTGSVPGTLLPGGLVTLPVNWDAYTNLIMQNLNTWPFTNFLGVLSSAGTAGTVTVPVQLNSGVMSPTYVGTQMVYAFTCNNPYDYVSNPPVVININP